MPSRIPQRLALLLATAVAATIIPLPAHSDDPADPAGSAPLTPTSSGQPASTDADTDAIEQIFVTASPLEHAHEEFAAPVTHLDRSDVLDKLGSTLGETLKHEPGIAATGFTAGASRPIVRGRDSFRVRVLEDGLGVGDASALSADHGVPINPLLAERIEVLRGPGTLRYGGGAIGGVVNAVVDRIPTRTTERGFGGSLYGGYGSSADSGDVALELEGDAGPMVWHLDAMYRDADDYRTPHGGHQANTFVESGAGSAAASYIGENGRAGFGIAYVDSRYGIPVTDDAEDPVHIDMQRLRYDTDLEYRPRSGLVRGVRARAAYSDYTHDEISRTEGTGATFDVQEWEGRVELLHDPVATELLGEDGAIGAIGLHLAYRDVSAEGEAAELLRPAQTVTGAGYAFEEIHLDAEWRLEFGARIEGTSVDGETSAGQELQREFLPLSGSAGVHYSSAFGPNVGLTVSVAQRAPTALELFAGGAHEASSTFERGDDGLDEETAYGVDFSVVGDLGERARYDASVFYTHYEDFVYGRLTGRTCDEDGLCGTSAGDLDELIYSSDGADFYGAEFAGALDLFWIGDGAAGVDVQFDAVRATLSDGDNVPRIPPVRWGFGAFAETGPVRARLGFLRSEKQSKSAPNESDTGAFTMLGATASYRMSLADDAIALEWHLSAENLLDETARNHASFLKDSVAAPGRAVRVGLRMDF